MDSGIHRRALITGASSGIGKATAIAFGQSGFDIALVGRSSERLASLTSELTQMGVQAKAYTVDLADVPQVFPRMQDIVADFGTIDVLVNNAGMGHNGPLATLPLEEWQQVMDLNLTSVLQCIQAVLPGMRQQRRGTVVNISSIASQTAFPDWGAYSVSKAGLMSLSRVLAAEERSHGIRITTICPGAVNTPLWDSETIQADFDRSKMLTPEIVAQIILSAVLLPQSAVIEDLTLMPSAGAL